MINRYIRKFRILIIFILCMSISLSASASTVEDLKKQQEEAKKDLEETKKQLEESNEEIEELSDIRKGITDEIQQIDDDLVEVMASISILEDEIKDIEAEIEEKKVELEEAIRIKNEQYEAMKSRIRFMYEKGDYTYMMLLWESQSMGDAINKADYIQELYDYDRMKLQEYAEAQKAVEIAKADLEEKQEELETTHYELELEKEGLKELMAQKQEEAEDYDAQIARAKQDAAAYKAQIKQQNAQIKKLENERKKAEEAERKRKEAEEAAKKAAEEAAKGENDEKSDGNNEEEKKPEKKDNGTSDVIGNSSGSAKGKEIANYACQFIGNPYVAGGTSLTNGADCSGFTQAVYKAFGYNIPRSSTAQRSAGKGVTYAEAQPGDLICYAGHVALYIGNGQIVHASTPKTGIKIGTATYREILAVRRII